MVKLYDRSGYFYDDEPKAKSLPVTYVRVAICNIQLHVHVFQVYRHMPHSWKTGVCECRCI